MPGLSNSRTGSIAQIYGSEWGSIPGVWTLDHQIQRLRVGLEPGTLDQSVRPSTTVLCQVVNTFSKLHRCLFVLLQVPWEAFGLKSHDSEVIQNLVLIQKMLVSCIVRNKLFQCFQLLHSLVVVAVQPDAPPGVLRSGGEDKYPRMLLVLG